MKRLLFLGLLACGASTPAPESTAGITETSSTVRHESFKIVPLKVTSTRTIELKADGSVLVDGKPSLSLRGNEVVPGYRLDGEELIGDNGVRIAVAADGTISSSKEGVIGKAENGASAKRTVLILVALFLR